MAEKRKKEKVNGYERTQLACCKRELAFATCLDYQPSIKKTSNIDKSFVYFAVKDNFINGLRCRGEPKTQLDVF